MVSVRQMEVQDVSECVSIHLRAFQGFFLTFLGPAFLKEFYTSTIMDPSGFGLVAESESKIFGFVVGVTQPKGFYKRLLIKRALFFAWAALLPLLKKPSIFMRLLRAFQKPSEEMPAPNCGTLMSIAVSPDAQGLGVGQALVTAFLQEASRKENVDYINLTTDRLNNESANFFYQKMGFKRVNHFSTPEGREMIEYLISLRN